MYLRDKIENMTMCRYIDREYHKFIVRLRLWL
jgi:hypothetical protein